MHAESRTAARECRDLVGKPRTVHDPGAPGVGDVLFGNDVPSSDSWVWRVPDFGNREAGSEQDGAGPAFATRPRDPRGRTQPGPIAKPPLALSVLLVSCIIGLAGGLLIVLIGGSLLLGFAVCVSVSFLLFFALCLGAMYLEIRRTLE